MPGKSISTSPPDAALFPFPGESSPDPAQRAAWESCFESWLADYTNPATRRKFRRAVEHCLFTLHKPPWLLTSPILPLICRPDWETPASTPNTST